MKKDKAPKFFWFRGFMSQLFPFSQSDGRKLLKKRVFKDEDDGVLSKQMLIASLASLTAFIILVAAGS